jgi:hypothetical protein
MAMRSHSIQQEAVDGVAVDPVLLQLRKICRLGFVVIALWAVIFIGLWLIFRSGDNSLFSLLLNPFPFIFALIIPQKIFYKRLERRRQAAARGDHSLLATEQPVLDTTAFPLPITIGQRLRWSTLLISSGVIWLVILIVTIALIVFLLPSLPDYQSLIPSFVFIALGASAIMTLLIEGPILTVFYIKAREQITVTEYGLIKVGLLRKVHSVSWEEARLFAIDGVYGSMKYPHPILYELSSARDVVRWGWMRRNSMRVVFFAQPAGSVEAYERQMQGLLSLIAARTGLPLYDLR